MASPYAGAQPAYPATSAAAAGQQNHLLAFRVMRLSRPSLQPDPAALLRFDPRDVFLPEDALTSPDPSAAADYLQRLLHPADSAAAVPGDFSFRDRLLLRDPADALALPGLLVLPQSFGAIYLGETFCSYISINNSSSFEARDVVIKPTASKDVDLRAMKVPPIIYVERPFMVLPLIEAFESIKFDMSLVATQLGVQKISGITMYAVQEKKYYEPLPDIEIFVDAE
ncbi:hypothetical protein PR202_gb07086 [Eleusine coracana subsp. coracana]|uniref:Trafficking protein particle complex subunit 13 N-terminal domain-containing protein n=1 Tax=Eleusine coracana subsp. coracana TaxID=191504 RepID=A0AAV5EB62_ELECO|nr:hypothetical protein PR202_gb07086 [Eleusine coracana subsp. coracana]